MPRQERYSRGGYRRALLCALWLAGSAGGALAGEPDWGAYNELLKRHTRPGARHGTALMLVDYAGIRSNPLWPRVVQLIQEFPVAKLATREERLSFYINAYNIFAIKMIVDHGPLASIQDAGTMFIPVWRRPAGRIGGKDVTLDQIEHEILRPMEEARIHMAIVCASISCPDLRDEPYGAPALEQQLDDQTRQFLKNSAKGLRVEDDAIHVSRIFRWFKKDFERLGGVESFVRRYREDLPDGRKLQADLPYDWALNGSAGGN